MPELPEVEAARCYILSHCEGRKVRMSHWYRSTKSLSCGVLYMTLCLGIDLD